MLIAGLRLRWVSSFSTPQKADLATLRRLRWSFVIEKGVPKMKPAKTLLRRSARLIGVVPLAAVLWGPAPASAGSLFLGTAEPFATLGASTQTNTGASTIQGDVGVFPGSSITGTGTITLVGSSVYHIDDAVALEAEVDATTAFDALATQTPTFNLTGQDLNGLTLTPGVYKYDSSANLALNGTVTLNFEGLSNTAIVVQIGSTLITGSSSDVVVENGTPTDSVYWEVGSSATLGTTTDFAGNIIALASITLNTGADILCGRAIALTGAITLQANTVSNDCNAFNNGSGRTDYGSSGFSGVASTSPIPEPSSALLLAMGLISVAALMRIDRHARPTR